MSGAVTNENRERLAVEVAANESQGNEGDAGKAHETHPFGMAQLPVASSSVPNERSGGTEPRVASSFS